MRLREWQRAYDVVANEIGLEPRKIVYAQDDGKDNWFAEVKASNLELIQINRTAMQELLYQGSKGLDTIAQTFVHEYGHTVIGDPLGDDDGHTPEWRAFVRGLGLVPGTYIRGWRRPTVGRRAVHALQDFLNVPDDERN